MSMMQMIPLSGSPQRIRTPIKSRIGQIAAMLKPESDIKGFIVESPDIDDRIGMMIYEINMGKRDPRIHQIAASAISVKQNNGQWQVEERNWDQEVDALFQYVRDNVRYTRDTYGVETFQKASRTLQLKVGDCDDLAILLGSLLQAVGYPVMLRVVGLGGNYFQHVYVLAGIPPHNPQTWKPLDASRPEGPGWEIREGVTLQRDYYVDSIGV
jgi:transglutaminase-like putative cysteine protease